VFEALGDERRKLRTMLAELEQAERVSRTR
jgi:hypothetical protein